MEKVWLEAYAPGVPPLIDPDSYSSLVALIDLACREFSARPAFGNFGAYLSFAEFDAHAAAFAAFLQYELRVETGDRIALMMPNVLAYPVALYGTLRCGAVVVNTNPQYTAYELTHQLEDSGARVLVVFEQSSSTVAEVVARFPDLRILVVRIGDLMSWPRASLFNAIARRRASAQRVEINGSSYFLSALEKGKKLDFTPPALRGEDLAFLQYTGGTTGRAKGAMLTHRNVVANILQVNAWFGPHTERGHEVIITALPLYHIYALTTNCLAFVCHGGLNYLITDPRNLKTFVRELKRVSFTSITGVNTLFNALLQQADFKTLDFSTLKLTSGGGMAVQRAVAEQWQAVTGSVIGEGYGLTEASPVVAANRHDIEKFSGSIGLPLPSTEIRIVAEDREVTEFEQPGELCVRGPQVMRGYWRNSAETARVLDTDGWLKTGDIAVLQPDGYLRIVDRKKDLILVSGFNVYPNEVEDVAVAHPGIAEAAAIGISDAKSGEALRLVVVRSDAALDETAVISWCREHLTAYKVPRSVIFSSELPKSNVGKILRREVRAQYGTTPAET